MTAVARSALSPTIVVIATAIENDIPLGTVLAGDKVYNSVAPEQSPFPYLVLDTPAERADNVFNRRGVSDDLQIHIWTRKPTQLGNMEALDIWDKLYALLHEQPLVVSGWQLVIGTLALISIFPDADGETMHGIASYSTILRQTP